jgi:hypothetical protein
MAILPRRQRPWVLFLLLSATDLALTCYLVGGSHGEVYEANWLAAWWLERYGPLGLALCKALSLLLTGVLVGAIALYRPRAARAVVTFGCAVLGVVVLYSAAVCAQLAWDWSDLGHHELAASQREAEHVEQRFRRDAAYRAREAEWASALASGRWTLADALAALNRVDRSELPHVPLGIFPELGFASQEEFLAARVVREALVQLKEDRSPTARGREQELRTAYQVAHGHALPTADLSLGPPHSFREMDRQGRFGRGWRRPSGFRGRG